MAYATRRVCEVPIPFEVGTRLLNIEQTIVKFDNGQTVDLGCLCYLRRAMENRKLGEGTLVDLTSFYRERAAQVEVLIQRANEWRRCGQRPTTVYSKFARFKRFMDWCDVSGHIHVLRDFAGAQGALRAHTARTRQLVDQHQISNNTAAGYQSLIMLVLEDYHGTDELGRGINLLAIIPGLGNSTVVPGEDEQSRALAWATCVFNGFSHLVLDRAKDGGLVPMPFLLKLPPYEDEKRKGLWIFPLKHWNIEIKSTRELNGAYDFQAGRLRTIAEVALLFPKRPLWHIRDSLEVAQGIIDEANSNPENWFRMRQGMLAMSAFYLMFMSATGQNEAQALEIPWSEDMPNSVRSPSIERQGFRQIKYRAGGRIVSFEVGIRFMPQLRRFLQLREFLLMGKHCDFLFFRYRGLNIAQESEVAQAVRPLLRFYRSLRHFGAELPKVQTRGWRAAKQNFVIRSTNDPVLSASMAQHSIPTALCSYNNGDEVTHQKEMGAYLGQMGRVVLTNKAKLPGSQQRALGTCMRPAEPAPTAPITPIAVDCKRAEGCLFCGHFRVHADERDVRKLLSARQCIRITGQYCASVEEHDRVMGPILKRIDEVLEQIRAHDPTLIQPIEFEVDLDGELDPYWSAKLDTLLALGMEIL